MCLSQLRYRISYSVEIEGDYPNFASEMQNLISQAYIDFLAVETSTGAAGVVGIFTALTAASPSVSVTPTTDGALGRPEDSLKVWNALPERSKSRAVWFANTTVESKLRTATAFNGLFTETLSSEGIGPLLGKRS